MEGKQLSSAGFADLVQDIARHGQTRASFLIGGRTVWRQMSCSGPILSESF